MQFEDVPEADDGPVKVIVQGFVSALPLPVTAKPHGEHRWTLATRRHNASRR